MFISLLVSVLSFIKRFLQVYVQEAGEGTNPIMSFLYPFVMIWNKKLSDENDIGYISSKRGKNRHDIMYAYYYFCHYDLYHINTILLATHNNYIGLALYSLMFYL